MYYNWHRVVADAGPRLWYAVFHAISAFCNAGFSTFSANLAVPGIAMHLGNNITMMLLIILGGLGFSVLWEAVQSAGTGFACRCKVAWYGSRQGC